MNRNLKIGVSVGGSLGDVLNTSALLVGLKRQFPQSEITFFLFKGSEVLRGNKTVNAVKILGFKTFQQEIDREKSNFDIFAEVRYPVKYTFSEEALKIKFVLDFKTHWEKKFNRYYSIIFDEFLSNIRRVDNFCDENGINIYELRRDSSCLDYTEDDQFLLLTDTDFTASSNLEGLRIVIVNNNGVVGLMTKSWGNVEWKEVINHLRDRGLYIVQVGTSNEPDLPGIHQRFYGTVQETAAVIKRSKFGIFIEGGLAHIAKSIGKKSIVLFGPTPISVFGYSDNINIKGTLCKPCWHPKETKYDWNKFCPKTGIKVDLQTPECMKSLTPISVKKAIDSVLIEQNLITKKRN